LVPAAKSLKLGDLVARARLNNPKVAEPLAEIAAAEGERELVDRSYYPDPTVTAGFDAVDPRGPRIVVGIGTKIPLQWGTREAQAREAIAKKGSAQARLDEAILKIESDLTAALASLTQAKRTKILLANALTQQSQTAYQAAFIAYQNGQGDLTSVLDAARQVLDVRLQLFRVETEEQTALAAIERLVGADL
ncbi:MAG TPA: TolC family protein, partial [Gemmatimonadales bacterium]|nr:TolC family protein [Gemmatimonadales bacterium]